MNGYGYGYAPFAPHARPFAAAAPQWPLAPYYGRPMTAFAGMGADPATGEPTAMEKTSAWLNTETLGVQRKWLVGGGIFVAGLAGLIAASSAGYFR